MAVIKDKKPQVNVTFKQKELDMFNYVKSKSSPANFMKDLLRAHMNGFQIPMDFNIATKEIMPETKADSNTDIVDEIINGEDDIAKFISSDF